MPPSPRRTSPNPRSVLERGSLPAGPPTLLWPPRPPRVRKKLEEQRGPPRASGLPAEGQRLVEVQLDTAQPPWARVELSSLLACGLRKAPGFGWSFPPPIVTALPPWSLSEPGEEAQGPGSGESLGFPTCQGRLRRPASGREAPPWSFGSLCDRLSSCTTPGDSHGATPSAAPEMLSVTPAFHSWRFKRDPG